jgi:hypothetical protein
MLCVPVLLPALFAAGLLASLFGAFWSILGVVRKLTLQFTKDLKLLASKRAAVSLVSAVIAYAALSHVRRRLPSPFQPVCPLPRVIDELGWTEGECHADAMPPAHRPPPVDIWLSMHVAQRSVLLLAALYAPRSASLWSLLGGEEDTLALLLGPRACGKPAAAAAAALRSAVLHLALPRTAQSAVLLSALWPDSRAAALAAAGAAALRGALCCVTFCSRVAAALERPNDALADALLSSVRCAAALLAARAALAVAPSWAGRVLLAIAIAQQLAALTADVIAFLHSTRMLLRLRHLLSRLHRGGVPLLSFAMAEDLEEELRGPPAAGGPPLGTNVKWPPPIVLPAHADAEAPAHLRCPVLMCALREPAVSAAGITYEREVLQRWVREHHTEPTLRQPMCCDQMAPNYLARAALEEWARVHPRPAAPPSAAIVPALPSALQFAPGRPLARSKLPPARHRKMRRAIAVEQAPPPTYGGAAAAAGC